MTTNARPLRGLLIANFLGAFNDHAYKMMVGLLAMRMLPSGAGYEAASQSVTTLAFVVFTLPLALLSVPAGLVADKLSKRMLIVATKVAEAALMLLAALVLAVSPAGGAWTFAILAGMGAQSALFSPAKLSIVPELVPHGSLAKANGALEGGAFLAIVLGSVLGGTMLDLSGTATWVPAVLLSGLAFVGLWGAWRVPSTPPARTDARLLETIRGGWTSIRQDRALWLAVLGLALFWGLTTLLGQALIVHAKVVLGLSEKFVGAPMALFCVGVGVGSWFVGRRSHEIVEIGFVPIGSLGLAVLTLGLAGFGSSLLATCILSAGLGALSGFVMVPLEALLQWKAPAARRGAVLAIANAIVFTGVLLGSLLAGLLASSGFSTRDIFLGGALIVVAGTVWALWLLPTAFVRLVLVLLTNTLYRVQVTGKHNVPEKGGALLTPNHVTFVDGLWLLASLDRPVRFLVEKSHYDRRWLSPILKALGAIPIAGGGGPRVVLRALRDAGRYLDEGEIVCIFPEGQLTRTGQMQAFRRGFERIAKGRNVPIVPVYLDRAWGSIFSRAGGRFLLKLPERVPYPIGVSFGTPLPDSASVADVRRAIESLSCEAALARANENEPLHRAVVRCARRRPFALSLCDGLAGRKLSRLAVLTAAIGLARALRGVWAGEARVGVLLPPSVAGAVTNLALSLAGKTSVNLNFTTGQAGMASASRQAALRVVVTSREFLEKVKATLPEGVQPVWVEEVLPRIARKGSLLLALLAPVRWIESACGDRTRDRKRSAALDVATVIFSSGSTGEPKGVELTHGNIASNVRGVTQIMPIEDRDRLLGLLPLFHSFGYLSVWFALQKGMALVCHPSPLDAPAIGAIVERYAVTILIATPTFLQLYARRCTPENFGSLRVVLTGAEKLPQRLVESFAQRFGVRPFEGYGASECAPVIATSTLDFRAAGFYQPGSRAGSVGRPLPGVAVRIVDPDSGAEVAPGQPGLLLVRGPNVMKGYLGRPDLTAAALRDGWYVTGDLARCDEDGFLFVTDRLSRFSKIGGEMVPHGRVEDALHEAAGLVTPSFAVTGVPDEKKGEKLVVLHTLEDGRIEGVLAKLQTLGLPNLFIPRRENFVRVEALPVLGTGKLDLRAVKKLAQELAAP